MPDPVGMTENDEKDDHHSSLHFRARSTIIIIFAIEGEFAYICGKLLSIMSKSIFSDSIVNTGRQRELDFVKGIAIIAMIICHTVLYMAEVPEHIGFVVADDVLGGPMAAPMFMICMGACICFSHRSTPLEIVRRGVGLFLLGYILNISRTCLPFAIAYALGMGDFLSENLVFGLMIVDILQFAGLALVFIGICFKLRLKGWQMLSIAIICSACGALLRSFSTGNEAVDAILGLFFGSGPMDEAACNSCFPFMHWIIFPVFGVLAGQCLGRCTDKEKLYRYVLAITLPITLFYIWFSIKNGISPFSRNFYYWPTVIEAFFFICLDLTLISLAWQLGKILPGWIITPLESLSKNITTVYFISWLLICWIGISLFWVMELEPLNPWLAYIPGVGIVAVSYWIGQWWNNNCRATYTGNA